MAFVQRDASGAIIAADTIPLGIAPELVADNDPALVAFLFAEAAAKKIAAVDTLLGLKLTAGMAYAYQGVSKVLQADPISQGRFTAVQTQVSAGIPLPAGFAWRAADNSFFPPFAGPADFTAMAATIAGWVYQNLVVSWHHKDALAAILADPTKTIADVDAYDVTVGWP
jgi:hypothetical protein